MAFGTRMFSRMNYQVTRGMKELYSLQELSENDWNAIRDYFDDRCAYCDKPDTGNPRDGLVADHLIPASDNGDYIIGNVVAACHDCNDRRGKKPWESWLSSQYPQEAKIRIHKIKQYLIEHHYIVEKPENRLTNEELSEYNSIMYDWSQLWKRAQNLRGKIKYRLLNRKVGDDSDF